MQEALLKRLRIDERMSTSTDIDASNQTIEALRLVKIRKQKSEIVYRAQRESFRTGFLRNSEVCRKPGLRLTARRSSGAVSKGDFSALSEKKSHSKNTRAHRMNLIFCRRHMCALYGESPKEEIR